MTMVAQGGPNEAVVPKEMPPESLKPKVFGFSELQHIAQILAKAAAFLHAKERDKERLIANLADEDYRVPGDLPKHPEHLSVEWIVEPALREVINLLGRSELEPFVRRVGPSYILMVRCR